VWEQGVTMPVNRCYLANTIGLSLLWLQSIRWKKREEWGGFDKGYFLK
jgi:hypothetical protein